MTSRRSHPCSRAALVVFALSVALSRAAFVDDALAGGLGSDGVATPDGRRVLINKQVGDERWAITVNRDGSVTGNVARPGDVAFLWCTEVGRTAETVRLSCFDAPTTGEERCVDEVWNPLGEVEVPASFLAARAGTARTEHLAAMEAFNGTTVPAARRVTPDGLRVLLNKDVGSERWAITLNQSDHTVNGNVFTLDGPRFLSCSRTGDDGAPDPDQILVTYACHLRGHGLRR